MGSIIVPAFLVSVSCTALEETPPCDSGEWRDECFAVDSSRLVFTVGAGEPFAGLDIGELNVLLYDAEGVRKLEEAVRTDTPGAALELKCSAGEKIAVALANVPYDLNLDAISRYESLELMEYEYEGPCRDPVLMSGEIQFTVSGDTELSMEVTPPLSCVVVSSVTNLLPGYVRLENPAVRLTGCGRYVEIMRVDGFRPRERLDSTGAVPLPYDVGIVPQYPDLWLWCSPNDAAGGFPDFGGTGMEFECDILGRRMHYCTGLPPLARSGITGVDIVIDGNCDCLWNFSAVEVGNENTNICVNFEK